MKYFQLYFLMLLFPMLNAQKEHLKNVIERKRDPLNYVSMFVLSPNIANNAYSFTQHFQIPYFYINGSSATSSIFTYNLKSPTFYPELGFSVLAVGRKNWYIEIPVYTATGQYYEFGGIGLDAGYRRHLHSFINSTINLRVGGFFRYGGGLLDNSLLQNGKSVEMENILFAPTFNKDGTIYNAEKLFFSYRREDLLFTPCLGLEYEKEDYLFVLRLGYRFNVFERQSFSFYQENTSATANTIKTSDKIYNEKYSFFPSYSSSNLSNITPFYVSIGFIRHIHIDTVKKRKKVDERGYYIKEP